MSGGYKGEVIATVEGVEVGAEDELQPGTYRVIREWDGKEDN